VKRWQGRRWRQSTGRVQHALGSCFRSGILAILTALMGLLS
jgi:hypothetical protein